MQRLRPLRRMMTAGLVLALLTAPAALADSGSAAATTSGEFMTLPGGAALGYEITGHGVMVRIPGTDTTRVTVHARGLDPEQTYGVHVHDASCDASPPGGGHYQHDVGGPVDPVNELWPTITTNAAGVGMGAALHHHVARDDARAIVIHWPPNPAVRLACLDLG
jgi:hypothetical protein